MASREELIEVFEDTIKWYYSNPKLSESVADSIKGTKLYMENDNPSIPETKKYEQTEIVVTKSRTFEAAMRLQKEQPNMRIAVHNFASATNPGGGVTSGSRAQEECLCRCSTLYPTLKTWDLWNNYYMFHRNNWNVCYTDACIYTPDIKIIKTDTDIAVRMSEESWCTVDVLTCAAPNLRTRPYNAMNPGSGVAVFLSDEQLFEIHKKRARHMLTIAVVHGIDIFVLGAFGCGAFQNNPEVVAKAYKEVVAEFDGYFRKIEFAVYCSERDRKNYEVFQRILGEKNETSWNENN